ncbi:She2p [Lachancea thermotolerans CBS 6340]|uniref:SWI5-dependent HO expression protein 2 n=1 Tax=Lachancea thermotolerans (strain ATCC 56472 / CBS 6340 / NRRL Y-8284) TaxID=559295 RepID=SHE2_LACTC|nr:KLTH0D04598p [Lachancea thermotolerans CBS 6340]C5DGE2.1 RecName: Full=SWI5-dependent HO expression protein 2 [Lachancea thermotolerans CBS 6340]CAR22484.1 KLTH0D04598p [Lachancea thermotolerans CBS 6340]
MKNVTFPANENVLKSLQLAIQSYSNYLSSYIDALNKYISHQRRVSTLRFERATLIKYVKKLRFFNEELMSMDMVQQYRGGNLIKTAVCSLASFFIRCLEVMDLLNYYLTQSLKNETISKTLNRDLVVSEDCVVFLESTYRHYVKFTQWMLEALDIHDATLTVEVLQFARKCAKEDGLDLEETDDILLQEVGVVSSASEYQELLDEWCLVLSEQYMGLTKAFEAETTRWSEIFEGRK